MAAAAFGAARRNAARKAGTQLHDEIVAMRVREHDQEVGVERAEPSPIARIAALTRATCALSSVSGRVRNCGACGTIAAPTMPGRVVLLRHLPSALRQSLVGCRKHSPLACAAQRQPGPACRRAGSRSRRCAAVGRQARNRLSLCRLPPRLPPGARHADHPRGARLSRRADRDPPRHPCPSRARLRGGAHRRSRRAQSSPNMAARCIAASPTTGVVGTFAARQLAARDRAARRHGLPADAGAERFRAPLARMTARCMPAAMTGTRRCCSAPRATSPRRAISTAPCISSSSPAKRATAAAGSWCRRGCSTNSRATRYSRCTTSRASRSATWRRAPGPMLAASDRFDIHVKAQGRACGAPASRHRPVRHRRRRSCWRCRRSRRATSTRSIRR